MHQSSKSSEIQYLRVRHSGCRFRKGKDVRENDVTNVGAFGVSLGSSDQRSNKKHKFTFELSLNANVQRKQLP